MILNRSLGSPGPFSTPPGANFEAVRGVNFPFSYIHTGYGAALTTCARCTPILDLGAFSSRPDESF